jgi:hypothetical protein
VDAFLRVERRVPGGHIQDPRSDGRGVGDAAAGAYEGAATLEVSTKGNGRRSDELVTISATLREHTFLKLSDYMVKIQACTIVFPQNKYGGSG